MNKSIISVDKLKLQKEFLENEIIFIKRKFKILESENILFSVWTNKFLHKYRYLILTNICSYFFCWNELHDVWNEW